MDNMTMADMVAARAGLDAAMAKAAADTERARAELDQAIERRVAETRREVLAGLKVTIELYEFKADEVFDKPTRAGRKVAVKWRDPSTGAEWSGRGKAPKWFVADRSAEFAV